jgi:FKBP-type peptidyl-prolyl cis-trans isomerase FkpA
MGLLTGTRPQQLGVIDGNLHPVRTRTPNAVGSQTDSPIHRIAPLPMGTDPEATMAKLRQVIAGYEGAQIIRQEGLYLYAEFTTPLMKFVDDVEFLASPSEAVIHVRSQSRLGRKDFGVNRARIETIRQRLALLQPASNPSNGPSSQGNTMSFTTTASGLGILDIEEGTGAQATPGARVQVHYTGWLYENGAAGKKFDSSKDRGQPFSFPLGAGHVIKGWDEGVAGMKVGGKRHLLIPAELGYGARGAGGVIPPNATLLFEVELLGL